MEANEKSLFPPRSEREGLDERGRQKAGWGWFGYEGSMCDRAIALDRPDMIRECVQRGWINPKSEMLDGKTILQQCEKVAPKCAEFLRSSLVAA